MVELYINNKRVDLTNNPSLGMSYSLFDITNPTAIKNPYSVSISIPKTDNNDLLFDNIYRLDRQQTETEFNPEKRVDFILLNNGILFERGYMQLTSITKENYQITLYGLLGDFFYSLKYKEDGTNLTLADLKYTDDDTAYFNFNINKDWVYDSFNGSTDGLHSFLKFIPAYNGIPEDFDASSCLVNTKDYTVFPTQIQTTENTYETYNGYGLAKLNESYTEWDIRDLRSYKQRPAIKLSTLIETICNNSKYKVEFDKSFFSEKNPYWAKTYMTLPLLGSDKESDSDNETTGSITETGLVLTSSLNQETNTLLIDGSAEIDLSAYSNDSTIDITVPVEITFEPNETVTNQYLYWVTRGDEESFEGAWPVWNAKGSMLLMQLIFRDNSNNIVGYSDIKAITGKNRDDKTLSLADLKNYTPLVDSEVEYIYKSFSKSGDKYIIDQTINLSVSKLTKPAKKIKIQLVAGWYSSEDLFTPLYTTIYNDYTTVNGTIEINTLASSIITIKSDYTVSTDTLITKERLLTTEDSAADYLISFAKLFGLYFQIDRDDNKIFIKSRNTFFERNVEDVSKLLDYSKEKTIEPLLFDKKWYLMKLETPDSYYSDKYKARQKIDYGQQRLNTGYEFNSEVNELYDDNVFQQVLTAQDSSKYYKSFFKVNKEVPAFMLDNCEWTLFEVRDKSETNSQTLYGYNYITKISEWGNIAGKDTNYKLCFFNKDKSPIDAENVIVFYNGEFNTPQEYWLTDDVPEMFELNEDRCWLYTQSEFNTNNKRIAYKLTKIPSYSRYLIINNQVRDSLDIGLPKEWFIDNIEYTEDKCIYTRFNQKYYNDLFDVNTRKLTCWGLFGSVDLNKFYLIDNTLYILNKADNFDISSKQTTQLEFVKVNDINNYTNGQPDYSAGFKLNPTQVEYNKDYSGKLTALDSWSVDWDNLHFNPVYTEGNSGVVDFEMLADENTNWFSEFCNLTFTSKLYGYSEILKIEQTPNPDISRKVIITQNILDLKSMTFDIVDNETSERGTYSLGTDKQYILYASRNSCEGQLINRKGTTIRRFQFAAGDSDINISL